MIAWRKTTILKEKKGIGLHYIQSLNLVGKIKFLWKTLNNKSLFASWGAQRYGSIWDTNTYRASSLWKELKLIASRSKDFF